MDERPRFPANEERPTAEPMELLRVLLRWSNRGIIDCRPFGGFSVRARVEFPPIEFRAWRRFIAIGRIADRGPVVCRLSFRLIFFEF